MDLKETNNMSFAEEVDHWWISTRFNYIDQALSELKSNDSLRILEFGCGTGQNMWYLRHRSTFKDQISDLVGVDTNLPNDFKPNWSSEREQFSPDLPPSEEKFDLILAMDVIEHIEDDRQALTQWLDYLKPGGVVLITVPAFQSLWSYHDVYLGHFRRYTKQDLQQISQDLSLPIITLGYIFSFITPAVYLIRKLFSSTKETSTDLQTPPFPLNPILKLLGKIECWCKGCPFFGTSVYGIYKKN